MAPADVTRALLSVVLIVIAAASWVFYRRQRRGGLGGRISGAKMAWLTWTVAVWFLIAPVLALDPSIAPAVRLPLGVVAASMWARGAGELVLLYGVKHWRPTYGIAHDVLTLAATAGACVYVGPALLGVSGYDAWVLALVAGVGASLVLELVYASWFSRIVGEQTVGDDAVWFADPEEDRFRTLNAVTLAANIPLYLLVSAVVVATFLR